MPFEKGNQLSKGRPKISLNKPELLLPIIFQKAHINWARDFTLLYRLQKERTLTKDEMTRFKQLYDLLPYLCSKVQLKDLDTQKFVTPEDSKAMARQTSELLRALEKETDGPNAKPAVSSKEDSLGTGKPPIPPTA